MADTPVFADMPADEIADFERKTGLRVEQEAAWSDEDWLVAAAYFRRKATMPAPVWNPLDPGKRDERLSV